MRCDRVKLLFCVATALVLRNKYRGRAGLLGLAGGEIVGESVIWHMINLY